MKSSIKIVHVVFTVVIFSLLLTLLTPVTPVYADEPESKCWAVFIGLSNYQFVDSAPGCAESATAFYEAISDIWGEEQCRLLTDEGATKSLIGEAFTWLAENARINDTVLVYYSAHGDPRGYLSSYRSLYVDSWVSTFELNLWLHPVASDRIAVIIDSCHSGHFSDALASKGRVILASSREDEASWLYEEIGGIFTNFLLDGIIEDVADYDNDHNIAAEEVFRYAESRTISETERAAESVQHPVMTDEYEDNLSLLVRFFLRTDPVQRDRIVPIIDNIASENMTYNSRGDAAFNWAPGSLHSVEVPSFYEADIGARYTFVSWEDGGDSPVISVSGGGVYTAVYDAEYKLTLESPYGTPEGQGWYPSGDYAVIEIEEFIDGPSVRQYFTMWSGDYRGNDAKSEILMSAPKNVEARWRTEYLLTIESAHGSPEGGGWYEEDTNAGVSVQSVEGPDARHYFKGWSGDYAGQEESFQITVDAPKTVTANWESEYLLTIDSEYGEPAGAGWYHEGDIAEAAVESVESPDTKHHFTGWSGDYAATEPPFEVTMDSARVLTANWETEYLLSIESAYGNPEGQGWYYEGTTAAVAVSESEGFLVRHIFTGWSGDYTGTDSGSILTVNSPMVIEANWRTDYLQLYILVGVLVIIAIAVYFILRARRRRRGI
jgi:uncharacterized repeat protein (TIGR02543 family)